MPQQQQDGDKVDLMVIPANVATSWECYMDHEKARKYYVNVVTNEKSWQVPPGCKKKVPINLVENWITFKAPNGKSYYYNKISQENTWHRPPILGDAGNVEDGVDDAIVRDEDEEFFIPEEDEIPHDHEQEEIEQALRQENEKMDALEKQERDDEARAMEEMAQAQRLAELRSKHEEEVKRVRAIRFQELLEERGIQPFSQWSNWVSKISHDERFLDVDVEERAKLFAEYAQSLIGKDKEVRKRRIASCRKTLDTFRSSSKEANKLISANQKDPAALIATLYQLRTAPEHETKNIDLLLAQKLHLALTILKDSDRKRALKSE